MPITVDDLKSELKQLDAELAGYDNKRRRRSLVAELLKTYGFDDKQGELNIALERASRAYEGMTATKAIEAFLKTHPADFFTGREISEALLAGGIKTESQNFLTGIHTNCGRKAAAGELELGEKDGLKAYRINPGAI